MKGANDYFSGCERSSFGNKRKTSGQKNENLGFLGKSSYFCQCAKNCQIFLTSCLLIKCYAQCEINADVITCVYLVNTLGVFSYC